MDAVFAHSRSKTTTRRRFRALFATVSTQQKWVTMDENIDPPLYSEVKSAVSWLDSSRWKPSKATKDANISRQGFGVRIFGCARYFVNWLPWERKNHQWWILYSIIGAFDWRSRQKTATVEVLFHQVNTPCHMSIAVMAKLHELHF